MNSEDKHPKSIFNEIAHQHGFKTKPKIEFSESDSYPKEFTACFHYESNGTPYKYSSQGIHLTKKSAEKDVYHQALVELLPLQRCQVVTEILSQDIRKVNMCELKLPENLQLMILIDHDNISNKMELEKLDKTLQSSGIVYQIRKIAGYTSSSRNTADLLVHSLHRDAVDHAITYYAGCLLVKGNGLFKVVIYTRDHFGACLQDINENLYHIAHVEDLKGILI